MPPPAAAALLLAGGACRSDETGTARAEAQTALAALEAALDLARSTREDRLRANPEDALPPLPDAVEAPCDAAQAAARRQRAAGRREDTQAFAAAVRSFREAVARCRQAAADFAVSLEMTDAEFESLRAEALQESAAAAKAALGEYQALARELARLERRRLAARGKSPPHPHPSGKETGIHPDSGMRGALPTVSRGEGEPSPHPSQAARRAASAPGGLSPQPVGDRDRGACAGHGAAIPVGTARCGRIRNGSVSREPGSSRSRNRKGEAPLRSGEGGPPAAARR